ncbi:MAG TPA: ankyrin repeat domain-containing protein [Aestuariivirga sp.]|nr:ankyrin repeat domain-containing protein [Aestuariivirga sp.]
MRVDLIFFPVLFLIIAPTSQAAVIHDAAKKGDAAAITAALDAGADANASDGIATPLYYAIDRAHLEAAKLLIARGANVNLAAKWGPPLLVAAESGKPELVKLLLGAGADAAAVFKGQTALHTVARNGCLDCVVALVEKGADVNALTSLRQPPIHFAKEKGHEAVAGYLLSHGYTFPEPPPVTPRLAMADPVKGETLFKKNCRTCHAIDSGTGNLKGPSLWNIVGRARGKIAGYKYTPALRGIGGDWSYENLNIFISDPSRAIPGTEMLLNPGTNKLNEMLDDAERADIIAFLRGRSDNPLPLP